MTCPICQKAYARTKRTELSVYVYRPRCDCRRVAKSKAKVVDIRDAFRNAVMR